MGQSPPSDDVTEFGTIPFLQGNAEFGTNHPTAIHYCDTAPKKCNRDDILMSVRAPVGETNVADQQYAIGRGLCAFCPKINRDFMLFALVKYSKDFLAFSNGSTFDAITVDTLKNFRIAVPPLNEQSSIVSFLNSSLKVIDSLISAYSNSITNLNDFRQSLIYEYVTGKKFIPGEAV